MALCSKTLTFFTYMGRYMVNKRPRMNPYVIDEWTPYWSPFLSQNLHYLGTPCRYKEIDLEHNCSVIFSSTYGMSGAISGVKTFFLHKLFLLGWFELMRYTLYIADRQISKGHP